jgi:hypothetical protein
MFLIIKTCSWYEEVLINLNVHDEWYKGIQKNK